MSTTVIFTPQPVLRRLINNRPYIIELKLTDTLQTLSKFYDISDDKWVRYAKLDKLSKTTD